MRRLDLLLYTGLLTLAYALLAPLAALWVLLSSRARPGLLERLIPLSSSADLWLHAASVGEALALVPLLEELRGRGFSLIATTQTVSGRETLRRRCPEVTSRLVPLDLAPLVYSSFARVRPRALVLVETELWPNLIWSARRSGVAVVLVSARISDRSLPRYRLLGPLLRAVLREVNAVGAQSEEDGRRLVALGVRSERLRVSGDLKLDRAAPPQPTESLCADVGPGPLLVGGSTHEGEEVALLTAWEALRAGCIPKLRLVLAPRHIERAPGLLRLAHERGARAALRTEGAAEADVVILDTIGELASVYRVADLVFCGGSLVPVGGHNLLEPVQAGREVVHGPHVENQRAQVDLLRPRGVLHGVTGPEELAPRFESLWNDPDRHARTRNAVEVLDAHRGAAKRSVHLILDALREEAAGA